MTLVKFTCLLANAPSSLSHYFLLTPVNLNEYTWLKQSWIEKLWVERGKRSLPSAFIALYLWPQYLLLLWWDSEEDNFKKHRHPQSQVLQIDWWRRNFLLILSSSSLSCREENLNKITNSTCLPIRFFWIKLTGLTVLQWKLVSYWQGED